MRKKVKTIKSLNFISWFDNFVFLSYRPILDRLDGIHKHGFTLHRGLNKNGLFFSAHIIWPFFFSFWF